MVWLKNGLLMCVLKGVVHPNSVKMYFTVKLFKTIMFFSRTQTKIFLRMLVAKQHSPPLIPII